MRLTYFVSPNHAKMNFIFTIEVFMKIGEQLSHSVFHATQTLHGDLNDYCGQWLVLYFYPKDATPGCTLQGQDFRDQFHEFTSLNALIFGISRDSIKSHERFKTNEQFPFDLISDSEEHLCQQFDVIKMKSMYGKQIRGIERSTFIIDPQGILRYEWRKVRVPGHVDEVLATLRNEIKQNVTKD